tara:strand:+ start:2082 stop:2258 length:177 start_codon:yes stop_codon:yes gene_type:complete
VEDIDRHDLAVTQPAEVMSKKLGQVFVHHHPLIFAQRLQTHAHDRELLVVGKEDWFYL